MGVLTDAGMVVDPAASGGGGDTGGYSVCGDGGRGGVLSGADPGGKMRYGCGAGCGGYFRGGAAVGGRASGCEGGGAGMPDSAALCARAAGALGVSVFDVYSLITWLPGGLRPRDFGTRADGATYQPTTSA